ncbi:MAG TPA: FAD:protein FMN transferase [Thermoanaerobaculia bacterium]
MRLSLCLTITLGPGPGWIAVAETVERRLVAMGTVLNVRVAGSDRAAALEASEAAVTEVARIERLLSTWIGGGPLDRLNRSKPDEPVAVGAEVASVLGEIESWSARTGRSFDPTVAPLVRAWDLRGSGRVPSRAEIARALEPVGPGRIVVDASRGEATRRHPEAGIDEGAWGKGYALDRAAAAAEGAGGAEVLVDLGGQILARTTATVAISDPRDRERRVGSIAISNQSISTSGNSERGRTAQGHRIGHLLDPHTGSPAPDFGSATAIAPSALVADILSTAFFVLGPERGLALSERLRRQGLPNEALFLVVTGDRLEARTSPALHFHLEETKP